MPMGTGATALLDAPEAAAVAALIASSPPTHASTTGQTATDHHDNANDPTADQKTTLSRIFKAKVTGDYADMGAALNAYRLLTATRLAELFVDGDVVMDTAATSGNRSFIMRGVKKNTEIKAKLTLDQNLGLSQQADERAKYEFINMYLDNAFDKAISAVSDGTLMVFENCFLDVAQDFRLFNLAVSGTLTIVLRNCELFIGTTGREMFLLGGNLPIFNLILSNCKEAAGTAAGKLVNIAGISSICNLFILDGTKINSLTIEVAAGKALNFKRDSSSEMAESLLSGGGTKNIIRVAGDQIRETDGPTLLDLGAITDGQHLKRSGTDLVGETLGSFRLLNSLAHSATTGQGADDHHAELHAGDHVDGTDDIQDATAGQKGLATAAQITKLDGIKISNTLTTSDGVFTTLATIPITDDTVNLISALIVGRRTDSADRIGGRVEAVVFREAAGSAALQGAENVAFSRTSDNQFCFQIIVSGNNALVQVKGRAGRTINWESLHEIQGVA